MRSVAIFLLAATFMFTLLSLTAGCSFLQPTETVVGPGADGVAGTADDEVVTGPSEAEAAVDGLAPLGRAFGIGHIMAILQGVVGVATQVAGAVAGSRRVPVPQV